MSVLYKKDDELTRIAGRPKAAEIDPSFKKKYLLDYSTSTQVTQTIAYNGSYTINATKHCRVFISYYTNNSAGIVIRTAEILYNNTIINRAGKSSTYPGYIMAGSYDIDAGDSITFHAIGESSTGNYNLFIYIVEFFA